MAKGGSAKSKLRVAESGGTAWLLGQARGSYDDVGCSVRGCMRGAGDVGPSRNTLRRRRRWRVAGGRVDRWTGDFHL